MRVRVPRSRVSHDRWLVSYADFMTLLFGLFVVLYTSAKADEHKQAQIADAIDSAFQSLGMFGSAARPHPGQTSVDGKEKPFVPMNIVMGEDVMSPARVKDDLQAMRRDLEQRLSNQIAQHTVSIQMGRDGLVISLREAGFFNSGSASPRTAMLPALRQVAAVLGKVPYNLRIEGHTDNIPIRTDQFDSNWDLSAARAITVAKQMLELHALPPQRLSVAGLAEYHPVDSNTTPEGRANNRRVDLIVLPQTRVNFSLPGAIPQGGPWRKITDGDPAAQ